MCRMLILLVYIYVLMSHIGTFSLIGHFSDIPRFQTHLVKNSTVIAKHNKILLYVSPAI